jgi:predicted SprT family Zn-dependent metalloprotease
MLSKLKELAKECENELYKLYLDNSIKDNIKNYSIRYVVNYRAKRRLGECRYLSDAFREINVSSWLLKDFSNKDIKNTIMHELLHCLKGCNNHGSRWQMYANIVNKKLGYNVKRLANVSALCDKNNIDKVAFNNDRYKYKITCKSCNHVHYAMRITTRIKNYYVNNNMLCGVCRNRHFEIVDLKENKIICDN